MKRLSITVLAIGATLSFTGSAGADPRLWAGKWDTTPPPAVPGHKQQAVQVGNCHGRSHAKDQSWVCADEGTESFTAMPAASAARHGKKGRVLAHKSAYTRYLWSFSTTLYYGIGETQIGSIGWRGGQNFNGRQGQVDDSANAWSGPPVRYDFRRTVRYSQNFAVWNRSDQIKPAAPAFTTGWVSQDTWFPYYPRDAFTMRWGIHLRAKGIINPSTADGTFDGPTKGSPRFECWYADGCEYPYAP